MEDSRKKGTVTSLASVFPVEESQKAAKRVEDAIAEKQNELDRVRGFVADNDNLINLVQKLPEQLSHDIMVPFGKAAFFPGRLIHTNEFLVLLGEAYYAERTSKQTVEILQRRGKSLDSQVNSLDANIKDLKAEASFFNATASDAAEGFVEILEDYVEKESIGEESKSGPLQQDASNLGNATAGNEEYANILRIMDELEKEEELAAGIDSDSDQNDETTADFDDISYQGHINKNLQNSEGIPLDQTNTKIIATEFPKKHHRQEDITDQLNFANLAVQSNIRDGGNFAQNKSIDPSEKIPVLLKEKIVQPTTASKTEVQHQTSKPSFDSRKAFTGSIIEHSENIQTASSEQNSTSSQVSGSQSSKPVSRFKMQRR
ncbi:RNA polymerase II subunit 5-mediating protein homolog isoform X2 [Abrus precatorius]|uniref:RNA polymerase II subunit 5-mediating protein homolog isoform X2 n=1 Tax=Abrus precatorius TaxID=3816 RepID=A0A8B8KWY1_ABRPR|nr:RNA polymerase II subunit 5-mediating protein homolog isoform X2 [Abrus precatorius]